MTTNPDPSMTGAWTLLGPQASRLNADGSVSTVNLDALFERLEIPVFSSGLLADVAAAERERADGTPTTPRPAPAPSTDLASEEAGFYAAEYDAAVSSILRAGEIMRRLRGRSDIQHPPFLTKMNEEIDRWLDAIEVPIRDLIAAADALSKPAQEARAASTPQQGGGS